MSISTATRATGRRGSSSFKTIPTCKLFLISLKAGGLGLNLYAAEYVYLLDPWWNPAVEAQAIDRAHRIGQTRHVFAYRLIARDTVEEKVLELQKIQARSGRRDHHGRQQRAAQSDPGRFGIVVVVTREQLASELCASVVNKPCYLRVISLSSLCQLSRACSYCSMVPPFSGYQRLKP